MYILEIVVKNMKYTFSAKTYNLLLKNCSYQYKIIAKAQW